MIEILLIINLVMMGKRLSVRGKNFNALSESQQAWVHSLYSKFKNSRAGRKNPMTVEKYLAKLSAE
ncbi:MAG: hypothetical protein FWE22_06735 [Firmicutes bacterium]|nr:hypothetical protein [Bacillota bacterium]